MTANAAQLKSSEFEVNAFDISWQAFKLPKTLVSSRHSGKTLGTLGVFVTCVSLISGLFYKIFLDMKEAILINSKGYELGIGYLKVQYLENLIFFFSSFFFLQCCHFYRNHNFLIFAVVCNG